MRAFNLIPAEERSNAGAGAGKSGGSAFVVLGLLGMLALLALLYGLSSHKISSQKAEISTLDAKTLTAQAQAAKLAPYVSFAAMHEQRVRAVDELVDSRFDWAHAFHELGRVLPRDASLSSLTGTIGASTGTSTSSSSTANAGASTSVASATPPGSVPTFTLSGCATSQTEVAQTITRLRLIDGVSEVTLQSATKSGAAGGGGSSNGCPSGTSTFAMQIAFDALPSATGSSPATSSTATPAAATGAPTSDTGRAMTAVGGAG
ncbi:MAG: hypothetical protein ACRDK7_04780 [Solirubrobacteraceae bacterium]